MNTFNCPLCGKPMSEEPDRTGVFAVCRNEPCDPLCHENPFGHGKNMKDAWETACQKFRKKD